MGTIRIRPSVARVLILPSFALLALLFIGTEIARADAAAFDLAGPRVEMTVTRAGKTLPISDVPNLQPGDRLWIHPDFPESQSVRYLLIVAFLRGSTNPPPDNWFTRAETWNRQVRQEGIVVTVPADAQQTLLFLAPETGGDFSTLRTAVRGKPGAFVRASQDLNQASLDRLRLEKYLNEVKETSNTDPKELHERSLLLARTLNLKLDQKCFDKPAEQQATCLAQNTDQLVLDDGHSQSMVTALTSGPSSDFIGAVSSTSIMGGGFYSAYVGAVVDLARILSNIHTAEYQYIPALAQPKQQQLNLRLNNPPSFRKPKSVLVVGLPAVEAAQLPPLRPLNAEEVFCLQKSPLVLPADGAPLVFADRHRARFCAACRKQIRHRDGPSGGGGRSARRILDRYTRGTCRAIGSRTERNTSRTLGIRIFRRTEFSSSIRALVEMDCSGVGPQLADCGPRRCDPFGIGDRGLRRESERGQCEWRRPEGHMEAGKDGRSLRCRFRSKIK